MDDYISVTALAVCLSCIGLAAGVGLMANGRDRGLQYWSAALGLHAVVYGLISLRNPLDNVFTTVLANVAVACVLALVAECVCRFQNRRCLGVLMWLPVVVVTVGLSLLLDDTSSRTALGGFVFAAQCLLIVVVLLHRRQQRSGGMFIVALGAVVIMGVFVLRAVTSLNGATTPLFLAASGHIQTNTLQVVIVSLMLLIIGFELLARPEDQS